MNLREKSFQAGWISWKKLEKQLAGKRVISNG